MPPPVIRSPAPPFAGAPFQASEPSFERRRPWIVCLVGYPGFGKSTQATALAQALGVPRLRLGRSLKDQGFMKTPEEAEEPRLWYERLLGYTDVYMNEIVADCVLTHGMAVLDGFPRAQKELDAIEALVTRNNWALTIVHFDLPSDEERSAFSLQRQRARAVAMGRRVNDDWYQGKIRLARDYELTAMQEARARGVRVIPIDPREPLERVNRGVRRAVRADFERLPWNWEVLFELQKQAPDAFVVGGSFYRPFYNGLFGPMQGPWDIGVAVGSDERVEEVRAALIAGASRRRWRVGNVVRFMSEKTGIQVASLEEALQLSHNLVGLSGGARLFGAEGLQVIFGPDAEAHLRRGILEMSGNSNPEEAHRKARRLVQDYPGLSAPCIGHERVEVLPDWQSIHRATIAMESGGRRVWGVLSPRELEIAGSLNEWVRERPKSPEAPPIPEPASLPTGFPWEAPDASFKEWLLKELREPIPSPSRDPLIETALLLQQNVKQKPTHQGWSVHQHTAATLLQLEIDHLPAYARRALRVSALFHDLGKKWNIQTPGVHPRISARRWKTHAPDWLTDEERRLATFFIAHHDLLGRIARGVKEPDYRGAIDPDTARRILGESGYPPREMLDMILALNRADIGSVAALRWMLHELDFAYQMVI